VDAMQKNIASEVLIPFLLILICFFTIPSSAESTIDNRVDANFNIEFITATDLKIRINLEVNEIKIFNKIYYNNDIQNIANSDLETMGAIKLRLRDLVEEQIKILFENANIEPINNRPNYENNKFHDEFSINLTSLFFGINDTINAHDFINGILDMSGEIYYSFTLQAEKGWNNTFIIKLPPSMTRPYTNGKIVNDEIQWFVKNWDGQNSEEEAKISIEMIEPTTTKSEIENIHLEFDLNLKNVESPSLIANIIAENIDIKDYDILPSFVTNLDYVPSDGIRLFIENKLITWNDLYQKTIMPIQYVIKSKIENSSFNQSFDADFSWNLETTLNCSTPFKITNMDNNPPLKAELKDNDIELYICGISSRALFGLINSGGIVNVTSEDINFGNKLNEIGYNYNGLIHLPEHISLANKNIYKWNQSSTIFGEFNSDISPNYSNNEIKTLVEIEVSSADLNLLSLFTGNTEITMTLYISESRNYSITNIPNEFNIPEKISLNFLNSDAIRLCIEEQVFTEQEVSNFLNNEKLVFKNRISSLLPGLELDGHTNRNAFYESITLWNGDISNMDNKPPINVVSYDYGSYGISFNLSFLPPKFDIKNQNFNFQGLQNEDIKYRVIFPHGTAVGISNSDRTFKGKMNDGREYIEVSFNSAETILSENISYKIYPSIFFILGIFMPCIVSFIITIILVIVIYLLRNKRKRRRKFVVDEKETDEAYQEQDYYVPPAPPSSK
jgi:hypothetical protein